MSRFLGLAAKESEGLLSNPNLIIDEFICAALRGEAVAWTLPEAVTSSEFNARCHHHGVAALLFHSAHQQQGWDTWPPGVRDELERAARSGVAHDLLRSHHLGGLLSRLADREIPCIVLKGEALAVSVYKHPGVRSRSDSDLFIRAKDVPEVRQIVLDAGYRVVSSTFKSHQFTVVRPHDDTFNVRFDIHWRILNAPRFARSVSFDDAFSRSVEFPGMAPARLLNHADALVLACMHRHGSDRHDRDRLIWIYDIHALLERMEPTELAEFAACAVERDCQDVCLDGLLRSTALFNTRIPGQVLSMLRSPRAPRSIKRQWAESHLGLLRADWRDLADNHARAGLLRELFVPPGDYLLWKYQKSNRWWLPVLYVRQIAGGLVARLTLR